MNTTPSVDDKETVVRILHKEWVVDGQLQITAFGLRQGESYISVNRPAIITNPMPASLLDTTIRISKEGRMPFRIRTTA